MHCLHGNKLHVLVKSDPGAGVFLSLQKAQAPTPNRNCTTACLYLHYKHASPSTVPESSCVTGSGAKAGSWHLSSEDRRLLSPGVQVQWLRPLKEPGPVVLGAACGHCGIQGLRWSMDSTEQAGVWHRKLLHGT